MRLRPLRPADVECVYLNVRHEAVSRWTLMVPYPYSRSDAAAFIRRARYRLRQGQSYALGLTGMNDDRIIGVVDLMSISQPDRSAALGYWLGMDYWGNGLMTDAVVRTVSFGFETLNLHRITAEVFLENPASCRVLEKAGFSFEGTGRQSKFKHGQWRDMLCFGLLKSEFQGWHGQNRPPRIR